MPQEQSKSWYTSKTLWVNIFAFIAAITGSFGIDLGLDPATQTALVGGIMAAINVVLRLVTKTAITA